MITGIVRTLEIEFILNRLATTPEQIGSLFDPDKTVYKHIIHTHHFRTRCVRFMMYQLR